MCKAARGQQLEKVTTAISDVLKSSLQSLNTPDTDGLSNRRTEAILVREAEHTLQMKLKRQRDAIEAPSFLELSPWLQSQLFSDTRSL